MYRVNTSNVAAEVARFSEDMQKNWDICMSEISANPFPRVGTYIERSAPILGLPMRTHLYEIAREDRLSGEVVFVLAAEFFPWYLPVYVVSEEANEIAIIFLRENHLV